ncbi:MAG: hypothetical protein H7Z21_00150 [Hymenobacter sp.]|nr:hypothetical protein [Hymenobacter sp.]
MNSYLVTPASEAEEQLLKALFQQMRVRALVVPAPVGEVKSKAAKRAISKVLAPAEFVPQNQAEQNMLEAVLELREVLAGRKEAVSMEEFWQAVRED